MTKPIIIGAPVSNYVWTTRIAFAEKGVEYDHQPEAPHSPPVKAIHPLGKIPCMRHGDIELFESKAICTYLDKAFPGPKLIPDDALEAAQVEQWISFVNTVVDPAILRQYVVPAYVVTRMQGKAPDAACIAAAMPGVTRQLALLDKMLAGKSFLVGGRFTLADAFLTPVLAAANVFPESSAELQKHANVKAYLAAQLARPSVRGAAPPPPPKKD